MKEELGVKESLSITLKRGREVIDERNVGQTNIMEELWKIIHSFSNTKG